MGMEHVTGDPLMVGQLGECEQSGSEACEKGVGVLTCSPAHAIMRACDCHNCYQYVCCCNRSFCTAFSCQSIGCNNKLVVTAHLLHINLEDGTNPSEMRQADRQHGTLRVQQCKYCTA